MATLNSLSGRERAAHIPEMRLAPVVADAGGASLVASQRFLIGPAGTRFIAVSDGAFHLVCGDGTIVATAASPGAFPAGAHPLVMPDGCTNVAMIKAASAAAAVGCAYRNG